MSECNDLMSTMCHINNMLNNHHQKIQYDLPKTSDLTRDTESQHNNRENLPLEFLTNRPRLFLNMNLEGVSYGRRCVLGYNVQHVGC